MSRKNRKCAECYGDLLCLSCQMLKNENLKDRIELENPILDVDDEIDSPIAQRELRPNSKPPFDYDQNLQDIFHGSKTAFGGLGPATTNKFGK